VSTVSYHPGCKAGDFKTTCTCTTPPPCHGAINSTNTLCDTSKAGASSTCKCQRTCDPTAPSAAFQARPAQSPCPSPTWPARLAPSPTLGRPRKGSGRWATRPGMLPARLRLYLLRCRPRGSPSASVIAGLRRVVDSMISRIVMMCRELDLKSMRALRNNNNKLKLMACFLQQSNVYPLIHPSS
jgi:hypothetical protein